MIVTSSNPLKDLRVLRHPDIIIAGGKLFESPSYRRNSNVDAELDPHLEKTVKIPTDLYRKQPLWVLFF